MIYISRGGTIDGGLMAALRARKFAGAGLDVFWFEPTPFDNPCLPCYIERLLARLGGGTRSAGWGRTRKY